jgi:hypothetical protein
LENHENCGVETHNLRNASQKISEKIPSISKHPSAKAIQPCAFLGQFSSLHNSRQRKKTVDTVKNLENNQKRGRGREKRHKQIETRF